MKWLLVLLGVILVIFGLATIVLPIPTGLISLLLGIAILAGVSPTFRKFFKWLRRKVRPLNTVVEKAEDVLPDDIAKPLRSTDPDENSEDDNEDEEEDRQHDDTLQKKTKTAASSPPHLARTRNRVRPRRTFLD